MYRLKAPRSCLTRGLAARLVTMVSLAGKPLLHASLTLVEVVNRDRSDKVWPLYRVRKWGVLVCGIAVLVRVGRLMAPAWSDFDG